MRLAVNGEPRDVPAGTTVAGLLDLLELGTRPVAVERNREIVPRSTHGQALLADGDEIEIVTMVGGG